MNLGLPLRNCQFLTEDPSHEIIFQILKNLKLISYIKLYDGIAVFIGTRKDNNVHEICLS